MPKPICCLCGLPYDGLGNNPQPLAMKRRCCDACNEVVTQARIYPAEMMEAIDRVRGALTRMPLDTPVAVICALRGPELLEQKMRELAQVRELMARELDDQPEV